MHEHSLSSRQNQRLVFRSANWGLQLSLWRWCFPRMSVISPLFVAAWTLAACEWTRDVDRCSIARTRHEAAVLLASEAELSRAIYDHAGPVSPLPSTLLVVEQSVA